MKPKEHVARYSTANNRRLKKVTEPLLVYGIDVFFYYSISEDGHFTYLSNAGLMAEHFCIQEFYKDHPFFRTPKFIEPGIFMPDCEEHQCQNQQKQNDDVSCDQLMMMGNKVGDTYFAYGFATSLGIPDLSKTYVEKMFMLKKFINYFHEETEDLMKTITKNKVHIAPLIGEKFYRPTDIYTDERDRAFLDKILKQKPLSPQEQACVYWLVRGRTARQIGEILGLSKRTIEHYLENVKDKWGCLNRLEVIEQAFKHFDVVTF